MELQTHGTTDARTEEVSDVGASEERSKPQQARWRQARLPTLSQRLNRMDAAHAPVPSMVIAGERPMLRLDREEQVNAPRS
jgi:hypothetical protein